MCLCIIHHNLCYVWELLLYYHWDNYITFNIIIHVDRTLYYIYNLSYIIIYRYLCISHLGIRYIHIYTNVGIIYTRTVLEILVKYKNKIKKNCD